MESSQDRNLPASEQKLRKARSEGQVSRSRDLSHLAVLGTGALAVLALAPLMVDHLQLALSRQLSFNAQAIAQPGDMLIRLQNMSMVGLTICAIFAALIASVAIISTVASGGWVASLKPVMPDFSRINPITGFQGLFSKKKLVEVAKMSLLTSILVAVAYSFLSGNLQSIAALTLQPSSAAIQHLVNWWISGLGLLLLVVLAVALIDVPLQSFLHKSELKMSRQEVKDEHKESEGNPQLKGKMRARQREIAMGNSIRAVPKADFVVMNPTHYAVAIQYDEKTMRAPRVISKGADLLAMKIRDVAKAHTVPVLQSPRLARALYANAELDKDIPSTLYSAVAQVLAYVYRLKAAMRGEMPMPAELPEPFVPPELDPLTKTNGQRSA
jgi:flagellar biosynthetic protein FlhB